MRFKAIIFDLDGTAIPNEPDGMPSRKVIDAVAKAQKTIRVSIATGRSVSNCRTILKALNIKSPSVVAGGTQIIDPKTEKTLWKRELSLKQLEQILKISLPYGYKINLGDEQGYFQAKTNKVPGSWQITYVMFVTPQDAREIIKKLDSVPRIAVHEVNSWKTGYFDIHITHIEATKKHSLQEVLKLMKIKKEEVIGVGDSNNDKPLFEVSGFKVAMGNGSDELKSKADYIAPSVEDDGLADVIEKFILCS